MIPIRALMLTLLLAATPLLADTGVTTRPVDPTSNAPVTLLVTYPASCPPRPELTRNGNEITVRVSNGPCLSPPIEITQEVPVGPLSAGVYTVTLLYEDSPAAVSTFTVLDADSEVTVSPSIGSSAGGSSVIVEADLPFCAPTGPACVPPLITFGGVPAPSVIQRGTSASYLVTTPPGVPGAALVTVTGGGVTKSSYAFRYYDPNAAPIPELFARFLIPVFYNGPGRHGSRWATEVAVRNMNEYRVDLWRDPDALPALEPRTPHLLGFPFAHDGAFVTVPRDAAERVHFNAIVRDVSRPLDSWGSELPVVRDREFRSEIELLNVPSYPGFRSLLRVYSLGSYPTAVRVTVQSMIDGHHIATETLQLSSITPCVYLMPCASDRPAVAASSMLDSLALTPAERTAITIRSLDDVPVWAFVTVTNNEMQHVTMISPH
jgi:hypothetical protein